MLESVVGPEGTGRRAALQGIRVAGKTGTAQKLNVKEGRYSKNRFRAWFVGIVPADAPRLVVVAALDEPALPNHHGGNHPASLFAKVASHQLASFGIHESSPTTEISTEIARATPAVATPPPTPPEPPTETAAGSSTGIGGAAI